MEPIENHQCRPAHQPQRNTPLWINIVEGLRCQNSVLGGDGGALTRQAARVSGPVSVTGRATLRGSRGSGGVLDVHDSLLRSGRRIDGRMIREFVDGEYPFYSGILGHVP